MNNVSVTDEGIVLGVKEEIVKLTNQFPKLFTKETTVNATPNIVTQSTQPLQTEKEILRANYDNGRPFKRMAERAMGMLNKK